MYTHKGKSRVRRAIFSLTGEACWQASRPGVIYIVGEGLHFHSWADAIAYATARGPLAGEMRASTEAVGAACQEVPD